MENLIVKQATVNNITEILNILKPYVETGIILPRSYDEILKDIEKFFIAYLDNTIIGVGSYYLYNPNLIEIRSLAIKKDYQKKGYGLVFVKKLITIIKNKYPQTNIFCLTYSPEFFKKANFKIVDKSILPDKIWKDCNNCKYKDNCTETAMIYQG